MATSSPPLLKVLSAKHAPNWRDSQDYPDPETTSFEVLAEEFMLRNANFRRELVNIKAMLNETIDASEVPLPPGIDPGISNEDFVRNGRIHAAITDLWARYGWEQPSSPALMTIESRSHDLLYGGLHRLIQEAYDRCPSPELELALEITRPSEASTTYWFARRRPGETALRFDLTRPLPPQLETAKTMLQKSATQYAQSQSQSPLRQRRLTKKKEHYRIYLRLLDADRAGVTHNEMARVLFSDLSNTHPDFNGRRRVTDGLDAAKALAAEGYRNLPLLEN